MTDPTAQIHPQALVEKGARVGRGTRVWAFSHILPGASIGEDCNICDHTFIEGDVVLGDRVTVKCGVHIWTGVSAEDDVFIGPSVVFTNDLMPRSRKKPAEFAKTVLRKGASVGANATILAGISIGSYCMIGAGSVVTKSIPDYAAAWGNPARFRYWICTCGEKLDFSNANVFKCNCGTEFKFYSETARVELCR